MAHIRKKKQTWRFEWNVLTSPYNKRNQPAYRRQVVDFDLVLVGHIVVLYGLLLKENVVNAVVVYDTVKASWQFVTLMKEGGALRDLRLVLVDDAILVVGGVGGGVGYQDDLHIRRLDLVDYSYHKLNGKG